VWLQNIDFKDLGCKFFGINILAKAKGRAMRSLVSRTS